MSVMKLNDEEYLFLAEMFLESKTASENNLGRSELYNIFRNLNVLGLCERYSDFFKEIWQDDKRFDYIYQQYNTIGVDINNGKSNVIIKNLIESDKVYNTYDEETDEISAKILLTVYIIILWDLISSYLHFIKNYMRRSI